MKRLAAFLAALVMFFVPAKVYAADFVPSIEQKDGPSLIEDDVTDENKKLIITPISQSEQAPNNDIADNLINAYEELKTTPLDQINSELEEAAGSLGGYTHEDLVISNVFDISVINDNNEIIKTDMETYSVNMDFSLKESEMTPIFIFKSDSENKWIIIDSSSIIRNPDNTITLFLKTTGQIAVLEADDSKIIVTDVTTEVSGGSSDNAGESGNLSLPDETRVRSPQTSDSDMSSVWLIISAAAVLAAVYGGKKFYDSKHS